MGFLVFKNVQSIIMSLCLIIVVINVQCIPNESDQFNLIGNLIQVLLEQFQGFERKSYNRIYINLEHGLSSKSNTANVKLDLRDLQNHSRNTFIYSNIE